MAIALHTSVLVDGKIQHGSFEIEADGLKTLTDLFDRADQEKVQGKRFFKTVIARRKKNALTILHNGKRLDLPKGLKSRVADGDEVNLLTPLVGG